MNFHNLVTIEIDDSFPWRRHWIDALGDVFNISNAQNSEISSSRVQLKIVYRRSLSQKGMRNIGNGIYIEKKALFDIKYGARLEAPEKNVLVLEMNNPCLEWIIWSLQLAFLAAGVTFVHGAAVERRGEAIIFPSWGGIGKTALVTKFVRDFGWKFLGDDLTILSADGNCYGFPKPMVLYPYHKDIFPEVFAGSRGVIAPLILNDFLTKAAIILKPLLRPFPKILQFARQKNPQSINIKPSEVFGMEKLTTRAQVKIVVWLDRVEGLTSPEFHSPEDTLPSRIMGSTLREFDVHCVGLTWVAMGLGIINIEQYYTAWVNTLKKGIENSLQCILYLPMDFPAIKIPEVVLDMLEQRGWWRE
jgi:hypothetical protein